MAPEWNFLTSHAHVLLCVADDPGIRLRDIATAVGITERSAHKILSQLVEEGYVLKHKSGRRNVYSIQQDMMLRHPLAQQNNIGELLSVLLKPA